MAILSKVASLLLFIQVDSCIQSKAQSSFVAKQIKNSRSIHFLHENFEVTGNANVDYERLESLLNDSLWNQPFSLYKNGKALPEKYAYEERILSIHRSFGMKLWYEYPRDERKYEWLEFTVLKSAPNIHYWENFNDGALVYFTRSSLSSSYNTNVNWKDLVAWEERYPIMRDEYFEYLKNSKHANSRRILNDCVMFDIRELSSFLKLSQNTTYRNRDGDPKIDLQKLMDLSLKATNILRRNNNAGMDLDRKIAVLKEEVVRLLDNDFISVYSGGLGMTNSEMNKFIDDFVRNSKNAGQREWGMQRRTLLKLRENPMMLKATTIDGRSINLEDFKGKVTLLDFWSVWCGSCIERMYEIKQLYSKYKNAGFEVISICLNDEDKLKEVYEIEEKINALWPTILAGRKMSSNLVKTYGFYGVPQLLLLNKEGKLIMLNDILRDGNIEPLLISLFQK